MQVIELRLGVVIITLIAEGVLSADGVCGGVLELHELAGGGVGEGYYITLEIIDVIIEFVAAVGHGDTVTLLVIEEAEDGAAGFLRQDLRSVDQVLRSCRAVALAGSDAFRIVSKGNCFILYRFCKLPTLSCPTHHMK